MNTLNDFRSWIVNFGKYASIENNIEVTEGILELRPPANDQLTIDGVTIDDGTGIIRFRLYTNDHCYSITARVEQRTVSEYHTYLGCIARTRKPRAGEDWTRGNDLADGKLCIETWNNILADIVSYELVRVHRQNERK